MFENIMGFFKKLNKKTEQLESKTNKDEAKERLHLVLMQDRANVSADFLDMMRQEIIDVIKKYIDVDEKEIDVRLTNKQNSDGTTGAPALYANIPIISIKNDKKNIAYSGKLSKNGVQNVENKDKDSSQNGDENVQGGNNTEQNNMENNNEEDSTQNVDNIENTDQSDNSEENVNNINKKENTSLDSVKENKEEINSDSTKENKDGTNSKESTEVKKPTEKNETKNNSPKGKKSKAKKSNKKK